MRLGSDGWQLSSYNGLNQLVGVEKDGVEAVYTYRADGMRHQTTKTSGNGSIETMIYLWDGANIAGTITNGSIMRYIRGIGLIVSIDASNNRVFYLFNGLGDVVQLANASGNVVRSYRFDAFGNEVEPDESDTNPFRYRGEFFDRHTGTYYLRARIFNPRLGRFTQEDPFWNTGNMRDCIWSITQAANLYVYTMNNPVRFIDPLGLAVWLIHGTFVGPSSWSQDFQNWIVGDRGAFRGESLFVADWSHTGSWANPGGGNSVEARVIAATMIFNQVMEFHRANPNEPIRLVGHSHGGNVAILATNMLAAEGINVNTLITIGTPVRYDHQLDSGVSVREHINLYSMLDPIQIAGGANAESPLEHVRGRRWIPAGRTFGISGDTRVTSLSNPATVHNNMHSNVGIWRRYIESQLR